MRYLLGIDIGTSACKAALFNEDGNVLVQDSRDYPVFYPNPGWAEQNPDDWWKAVCEVIRTLISGSSISAAQIAGIGIDGQSWSAIAVDESGRVLTNTPIWMDTRADDICREWERTIGADEIFSLCGNPVKPSYTTPKIIWYKRNLPEVYRNTYKILQSNSFIVHRLTGQFSQDLSQGYGLHCFDIKNRRFDEDMCTKLGIDTTLLPPIYACHDIVGCVTEEAARLTGLLPGTPVVAGGLDAACGTLGAGVIHPGETQEQGGQAGGMSICTDSAGADIRLILSCHVVPGRWLLQGGTVGGGGIMRWMERELGIGTGGFRLMDEQAAKAPAGSDGLIMLPYMAGERSPIWDKDASGVFFGLDYKKTRAHLIRAGLEGVAYSLRHNLEAAEEAGAKVDVLRAMGGAANSLLWTQIKADVTGKRIVIPSSDTATTWGAAMLAGVGTGVFRDFDEAVGRSVRVTREHIPDMSAKAAYDKGFDTYKKLYPALKELMSGRQVTKT